MSTEPLKETKNYTKKIYFFGATHNQLIKHGIKHDIEKTFQGDKKPDFFVYESTKSALEHKFSLPQSNEFCLKEIEECHEKYKQLDSEGQIHEAEVILALPKTCKAVFENVKRDIKSNTIIWIFNLNLDESTLSFKEEFGKSKNTKLIACLLKEPFAFNPTDFSKIRFLRDEPHVVYTAVNVWLWLQQEVNPLIKKDFIEIKNSRILEIAESFCPKWVLDRRQLTTKRLKKALRFLSTIGFVKIIKENNIRVFHRKGKNAKDLATYFSELWEKNRDKLETPQQTSGRQTLAIEW